ncbi:MAG: U32 family peptidase [Bacteroidales bacterium]|nr:U32 family peptidase [Bacteroidales bacterium]
MNNDIEITAPVGSYETLMAAIHAGADSVYFGVGKLNLRAASIQNFTLSDLREIVKICRDHNVKTYLTVNSIIYDDEMNYMKELIDAAKQNNIDAIIATDFAVLQYCKTIGIPAHASTQLNISNIEAVKFFSPYCDVMVLARELTLEQIKYIVNQIKEQQIKGPSGNEVKIEVFVHGALCMSISGKCYISLHENSHSANRGECLQNCRRRYKIIDIETGYELEIDNDYILSPKDLCTIHILDKIVNSGVKVLKIEGRARSPEYVYYVTKCYKEAIQAIKEKTYNNEKIENWLNTLKQVYNRGFWVGHYLGQKHIEWSNAYGSVATRTKIYAGKVINYFKKINVAEILVESYPLKINDEILITGPTTGIVESIITELRNEKGIEVERVEKKTICSIFINKLVRKNDKVYVWKKTD